MTDWIDHEGKCMTDDNTIDAEITHVEEHDEMVPLEEATTRVIPAMSKEAVVIPDRRPALRVDPHAADQLDYEEDYSILRVLFTKIFRRAIIAGVQMPDIPELEMEIREELGSELEQAITDLDDAREGKTDIDWQLAEWKEALAA